MMQIKSDQNWSPGA